MRHVGRQVSDTLAQSYVHETSQTPGAAAEAATERKRNKYSSLSQSYLFVPIAAETRGPSAKTGWTFVRTWKAHHTMYRWPPRERLPLSATIHFNSTLQCGRCFGYLHPHNPRGGNVAVPAFVLVFSLVFSPLDLYYRGQ